MTIALREFGSVEKIEPKILANKGFDELLEIVKEFDTRNTSTESIHSSFFDWCNQENLNLTMGAVKTPKAIARFIIDNVCSRLARNIDNLDWLDPCAGSGVFIEEILTKHLARLENDQIKVENLPKITAFDISSVGIFHCLLVIKKILEGYAITLSEYLSSGRLNIFIDNTLSVYKERVDLIDTCHRTYDAVVGNPPYVRATRLSAITKNELKQNFPSSFSGNADLYFYFITSGIISLKENGVLSLITPANFLRASSAENLRTFLLHQATLKKLIDLDEMPVFDNADIHTLIFELQKSTLPAESVDYLHLRDTNVLTNIDKLKHEYEQLPAKNFRSSGWITSSNVRLEANSKLQSLKDAGFEILSGVRPSYKKAFVYQYDAIKYLNEDAKKWFCSCVEGRDIRRWKTPNKQQKQLLLLKYETPNLPKELESLLSAFEGELKKRAPKSKKDKWYALRQCSYYDKLLGAKIVFPDITTKPRFSIDDSGTIPMDGTFCIPSESLALLGILNSNLAWKYFTSHCSSIGNAENKGRVRLKKVHVENFPIPINFDWNGSKAKELDALVSEIISLGESEALALRIDKIVEEIYQ
jgi:hypothetical protein